MSEGRHGSASYEQLLQALREAEILASTSGILSWDQETMLPERGTALRAEQISLLSGLVHERRTDPQIGEWLAACESDVDLTADPDVAANLREIRREYERAVRVPGSLVRELAQTTTHALQAWRGARERSDYAAFAPWLEKIFQLSRAKAECLADGSGVDPYDALMEEYEPGTRAAELEEVFGAVRARLAPLIAAIADAGAGPNPRVHHLRIPIPQQVAFNRQIAERLGFDFAAGRLDTSTHPFCQGIGPGDTRLTTRYSEENFPDALSSTLHETGHGLYEQGLPKEEFLGQPRGEAASLGIHESQSRLWENLVGRSRPFWEWALPEAQRALAPALDGIDVDEVYRAVNRVEPNLIRVDSDEATYNLHIMLRFDLERALLRDELRVADLPGAWRDRIRADLGLEVPDDRRGVLQDIHWSMGAIGYFPTYTLGNLYAAQLWAAARRGLADLDEQIARGDFAPLLGWLREHVHRHGRRYSAGELCERASGARLSAEPFLAALEAKLRPLYGV